MRPPSLLTVAVTLAPSTFSLTEAGVTTLPGASSMFTVSEVGVFATPDTIAVEAAIVLTTMLSTWLFWLAPPVRPMNTMRPRLGANVVWYLSSRVVPFHFTVSSPAASRSTSSCFQHNWSTAPARSALYGPVCRLVGSSHAPLRVGIDTRVTVLLSMRTITPSMSALSGRALPDHVSNATAIPVFVPNSCAPALSA